jgi:hypothetical protein
VPAEVAPATFDPEPGALPGSVAPLASTPVALFGSLPQPLHTTSIRRTIVE